MTFNPKFTREEPNLYWFGAKPGSTRDNTVQIQNAWDEVAFGELQGMMHPPGQWGIEQTLIFPNSTDGASLSAPFKAPPNRFAATTIFALPGSNIPAVAATNAWYNNVNESGVGVTKDVQGFELSNIGFWGGGWKPQENHDGAINTSAEVDHCVVIHGSTFKVHDCSFFSSNLDGLFIAGTYSRNGSNILSESHEMWLGDCATRYNGRDGVHLDQGAQDGQLRHFKIQYAGRDGIRGENKAAAWHLSEMHPSRCGSDMIHSSSGWEWNVHHCYLDAVGDYMDGEDTPYRSAGDNRYGIWIETGDHESCHVDANEMHTESTGSQLDPVIGLHLKGWMTATNNTLMYETTDFGPPVMLEDAGTTAWSTLSGNVAHT